MNEGFFLVRDKDGVYKTAWIKPAEWRKVVKDYHPDFKEEFLQVGPWKERPDL